MQHSRFLAGSTNLVDLLKENVERPAHVIDIHRLPMSAIDDTDGSGLRIGALATNADTAYDPRVAARYPLLASAVLAIARNCATSPQRSSIRRPRAARFWAVW